MGSRVRSRSPGIIWRVQHRASGLGEECEMAVGFGVANGEPGWWGQGRVWGTVDLGP
jgi:hypothetical protein